MTTRAFVNRWLDRVIGGRRPPDLADDRDMQRLITNRERALKGTRARLGNPRALELWTGSSAVKPLDYRWSQVQAIVNDIRIGLR